MRNIVDLNSRAPPTQYRMNSTRPIDFLIEHEAEIKGAEGASGLVRVGSQGEIFPSTRYANALITPVQLRRRCIEMGFVSGKRSRQSPPEPPMPPPAYLSSRLTQLRPKSRPVKPRPSVKVKVFKGVSPGRPMQSGTDTDSSYINVPTDGCLELGPSKREPLQASASYNSVQ